MTSLLVVWFAWHLLLLILAILARLPAWIWIDLGLMRVREFLRRRAWVDVIPVDGWVGYYWQAQKRRLFLSLLPGIVIRIDVSSAEPDDAIRRISIAICEAQRAENLTDDRLAAELIAYAGSEPRQSAVIEAAASRLRSI